MIAISEKEFEVIFDPVAKSLILRDDESLIFLDGPFKNYAEAIEGARVHIENLETKPRRHS